MSESESTASDASTDDKTATVQYTVDFSSLKLYTVSISLTFISGSDRFVADKSYG